MSRWANEDLWAGVIAGAAARHGIPVALLNAVIAVESGFRPDAYRPEVAIGDGSAGLTQILLGTARGEGYAGVLGEGGNLTGLFDPATNIEYGASYLARQYTRASGDIRGAASAYNGGWRPSLGFGVPATVPLTVVLARDALGNVLRRATVQPGQYGNQSYVDAVMGNYDYFAKKQQAASLGGIVLSPTTETGAVNPKMIATLVGLLLGLLGLRYRGRSRG